jgi:hypothetical protein
MKKETQLGNEIKKLQYQLSYSEHISTTIVTQTRNSAHRWPASVTNWASHPPNSDRPQKLM